MKLTKNRLRKLINEVINESFSEGHHALQRLTIAIDSQARDRGFEKGTDFYREFAERLLDLKNVSLEDLIAQVDEGVFMDDIEDYIGMNESDPTGEADDEFYSDFGPDSPGYGDLEDPYSPYHVAKFIDIPRPDYK